MKSVVCLILCFFCSLISWVAVAQTLQHLTLVTEDNPPFNYLDGGKPAGLSVDLLVNVADLLNTPISGEKIQFLAWRDAFTLARNAPSHLLISAVRTPEREALFKWAGPIGKDEFVLLGKKSRLEKLARLDGLRIATLLDDASEKLLRDIQPFNFTIWLTHTSGQLVRLLDQDKVDLVAYSQAGAHHRIRQLGLASSDYVILQTLASLDIYFAFSLDTDDILVRQVQAAIDSLTFSDQMQSIQFESKPSQFYPVPKVIQ